MSLELMQQYADSFKTRKREQSRCLMAYSFSTDRGRYKLSYETKDEAMVAYSWHFKSRESVFLNAGRCFSRFGAEIHPLFGTIRKMIGDHYLL